MYNRAKWASHFATMKQIARIGCMAGGLLLAQLSGSAYAQQTIGRPNDPFGLDTRMPGYLAVRGLPRPAVFNAPNAIVDRTGVTPGPISVDSDKDSVTVHWPDEKGRQWTAVFALRPSAPLITAISVDGNAIVRNAQPYYQVNIGKRRGGWDEFFDNPTSSPEGTRTFRGNFIPKTARAVTTGNRVELIFDGLTMGPFTGSIRYTFYPNSRLIEQSAVVTTQEADTAFLYNTGLSMTASTGLGPDVGPNPKTALTYYDLNGTIQEAVPSYISITPLAVRYRTIATPAGSDGSIAVFPAPHRYFPPRDYTNNMGYVWHQATARSLALGIRQPYSDGGYYPWSNAPPGTEQRLSMFLLVSSEAPRKVLQDVLAFTNSDRFPAIPGYVTFAPHWHFGYTVQALKYGADWTPPFKPELKDMGVNSALIFDFHAGDGHPEDTGETRIQELAAYYDLTRKQSDDNFLLIPGEEANVHFGGHWGLAFPKPVFWHQSRKDGQPFETTDPKYGTIYNVGNRAEMLTLVRKENGFVYQAHPRTKGSFGYPEAVRDEPHFLDPHFFGTSWKALPSDFSTPRMGERAFKVLDDMSNWGVHKRMMGEVDVFKVDSTNELYAHMNINYVRLKHVPSFDNRFDVLNAVQRGDFFISTGEVLIPDVKLKAGAKDKVMVQARIRNNFPLQMAEIVWGDGAGTYRKTFPLTQSTPFGTINFKGEADAKNWKWARFAVWDIAANGAFVNPIWR
jgi:hypothetical protein